MNIENLYIPAERNAVKQNIIEKPLAIIAAMTNL